MDYSDSPLSTILTNLLVATIAAEPLIQILFQATVEAELLTLRNVSNHTFQLIFSRELKHISYLVNEPQYGSGTEPFSSMRGAIYDDGLLVIVTRGSGDLNNKQTFKCSLKTIRYLTTG